MVNQRGRQILTIVLGSRSFRVAVHLLPFFFAFLFGVFDAAQTARKDYPDRTIFWDHSPEDWSTIIQHHRDPAFRDSVEAGLTVFTTFDLWYVGGNEFYSPVKYFWSSDFWHSMKNLWVLTISAIGLCCIGVGYFLRESVLAGGWKPKHLLYLSYVFLYWVEGGTFAYFYRHIFPS